MIPEVERWKRFPAPWRTLGPRMAAEVRAAAEGHGTPGAPPAGLYRKARKPGSYKRGPPASGFQPDQLRSRRKAAGYSQSGLAYLIGTSQGRLSSWEMGDEVPPLDRVEALARALDCRPEDLCADDP